MVSFNPACHIPSAVNQYLPSQLACAPPPTYLYKAYDTLTSPLTSTYTLTRKAMGALLSVPMLSFLLVPTMTSYSTSLNLLFFYLTWSTLVLSHPPLRVELVATLAVRLIFYLLPSTVFLIFDALLPSAAESFKATSTTGLPFYNASRRRALKTLRKISWSLLNILAAVVVQAAIELLLTRVLLVRSALKITTSLPLPWSIFTDLLKGFLAREVLTYLLHRYVLHESNNFLSTAHEGWYHSISSPFPLSASYDHPAAYLIRSFLPTFLPAMIFRFHLLTYMLYTLLISLEETFAYSGYSTVPTNFILGGIARRTDNHVLCGGEGNFGPLGVIDWIMGTSVGGDIMDDVAQEADKHDVQGRVKRKGNAVGNAMGEKVRRRVNGSSAGGGKKGRRSRSDS